jgi:glutathione S-transferase
LIELKDLNRSSLYPLSGFNLSIIGLITIEILTKNISIVVDEILIYRNFSMHPLPSLVTILSLLLYLVSTINVIRARVKYGVSAPNLTGNSDFERVLRVQQNTLEQLVLFLPVLWLFSLFVSSLWGTIIGVIWIVGRVIYAWGYYQTPKKRLTGFGVSLISAAILLIGSFIGVIASLI